MFLFRSKRWVVSNSFLCRSYGAHSPSVRHQRTHISHSWSECCRAVRPLRALLLLDQYRQKSRLFRSSVLLVTLGDDFRYTDVREWDAQFTNYQKLFDYFNQHPELHIKVNTLRHVGGGGACGGVKISLHWGNCDDCRVWTSVLLLLSVSRLVSGLCQITLKLFIGVWVQLGRLCRHFVATSSRMLTVTIITGVDISPPDRFINVSTERWSPCWGIFI